MATDPATFFANYTKRPAALPRAVWRAARLTTFGVTLGIIALLAASPALGLTIWWRLTVPLLPLLIVLAPGLWRQVCPMAFLNQLPRAFGKSRALDLPPALKNSAFAIAVAGFVAAVALRVPFLNHDAALLAAFLAAVLLAAFAGGLVFKGRSGWCGTFCPLGPIQRVYGQAPPIVIRNGYCEPCLGCQKNCYDFNPRGAVYADMTDDDPRYASQRRLFFGLLPGLILGYFLQGPAPTYGEPLHLLILLASAAASAGFYGFLTAYLPLAPYRVAAAFTAAALIAFYWFSGPTICAAIANLTGVTIPDPLRTASQFIGVAASLSVIGLGFYGEKLFSAARNLRAAPATAATAAPTLTRRSGAPEVMDRATSSAFPVAPGATLLEAIEKAGLKINFGCRAGMCGADAVAVCEGAENLSPMTDDERATLARMGLGDGARLACMCEVCGPVLIDRDPKNAATTVSTAMAAPAIDRAAEAGFSRVIIIGNGVAGSTAAEKLRRASASLAIDVITNEPTHFYNRMAIGRMIYDHSGMDGLQLMPDSWFEENRVEVWRNTVARTINPAARTVQLATGETLTYDRLIIATGARASTPTPDFLRARNAFVLRTAQDAQTLRSYAQTTGARHAVVIGGGVLGVEAAEALNHLGLKVTILQRADRLMNAQLDEPAAARLETYLTSLGIRIAVDSEVSRWEGGDLLHTAWLSHGPRIRADLFVACLGVSPNMFLAANAGLETAKGIKVNAAMQTSDAQIYAIGDVAEATGPGGLWPVGAAQAEAAVEAMLGGTPSYTPPRILLRLKSEGIDLRSFGDLREKPGDHIFTAAPEAAAWWKLVLRNNSLSGAVYVGPPTTAKYFAKVVQNNMDLTPAWPQLETGDPAAFQILAQ